MMSLDKLTAPNLTPILPIFDVESSFRTILDLSMGLEIHHKYATSYQETFEPEILEEKAILLGEIMKFFECFHTVDYINIEYGERCEEILWKNYFYQNYRLFKLRQSTATENEIKMFKIFLHSGLGTYYSLIFNLQATFNLKELNFVSYLRSMPLKANLYSKSEDYLFNNGMNCKQYDFGRNQKLEFKSFLIYLFGRFFTCIGDLTRYLIDCFPDDKSRYYYKENAVFSYKCASIIEPSNGMPFNQLGTLLRDDCFSLNSLYYYVRSLKSKSPFIMSNQNICRVFETLKKFDSKRYLSIKTKEQFTERALHAFLSFYAFVYQAKKSTKKFTFGSEYCVMMKSTIEKIAKIISIQRPKANYSKQNPDHLTPDNLIKMLSLVFILIDDLLKDITRKEIVYDYNKLSNMDSRSFTQNDKFPFLLHILLQFLFELLIILVCHEKKRLEAALPNIAAYDETRDAIARDLSQIDSFQFRNSIQAKKNKIRSGYSFSSEAVLDEDSQTISNLKSTAINSIVDLFDHPEMDKCLNEFEQFSVIDENDNEDGSQQSTESDNTKNLLIPKDVRSIITLLDSLYMNSFTPVVKMFCDFVESNSYLFKYGSHCPQFRIFFRHFYDYVNLLSEFDYKLITGFKHLFCNVPPDLKTEAWISYYSFVIEQRKIPISEFQPKFPPGVLAEFLRLTKSTQIFYERKYNFDNIDCLDEFYKHLGNSSTEEMSHSCLRSLLKFCLDYISKLDRRNVRVVCEQMNHNFEDRAPMCFIIESPIQNGQEKKNTKILKPATWSEQAYFTS